MTYRKPHQIFLKTTKFAQIRQNQQCKTFNRLVVRSSAPEILRYGEYDSFRKIVSRKLQRLLRVILLSKPYVAVTAKPKEIRMGKGKGGFSHYTLPVTIGQSVIKVEWCHRISYVRTIGMTKNAMKKERRLFPI